MKIIRTSYKDLEENIINDFKDIVEDIEYDYEMGLDLDSECYMSIENDKILGYMCFFNFDEFSYVSYTKAYEKRAIKYGYKILRDKVRELNKETKRMLIDDNRKDVYSNHIVPDKLSGLFQVII